MTSSPPLRIPSLRAFAPLRETPSRRRPRPQVPRREGQPQLHLLDLLLHQQRGMSRLETVVLVRLAQLAQTGDVVLNLADRAAWVVGAARDQDRYAQPLGVLDRRALAVDLRVLRDRAPAEERLV